MAAAQVFLGSLAYFHVDQVAHDIQSHNYYNVAVMPKYRQKTICVGPGVVLFTVEETAVIQAVPAGVAPGPPNPHYTWVQSNLATVLAFMGICAQGGAMQQWSVLCNLRCMWPDVDSLKPPAPLAFQIVNGVPGFLSVHLDHITTSRIPPPLPAPRLWYNRHHRRRNAILPEDPMPPGPQRQYQNVMYGPQVQNARSGVR
ncbi:hypothetical protein B0H13DRAFT_2302216 [Mycena leptocephala]|nr:hypothetical protein B0H13DRAFT_2302216 [Mycena leptocephala]